MSPSNVKMKKKSAIKPSQMMRGHINDVRGIVHLPGGRRIITCSGDGSLRQWDLESGAQIGDEWRDDGDEAGVWCIGLSPNGKTVGSVSRDGTVRLWNVETSEVITKWTGHTGIVESVCWTGNGDRLVSGSNDGTARFWDVESGKTVLGPIKAHTHVFAVICSADMEKIATGGDVDSTVKIWDASTGELLSTLKHEDAVLSLAWTSDQKNLISGGSDGFIRIFDTATWQQTAVLKAHKDHGAGVRALSLFRNDRLLVSASFDQTARLWNLNTNLQVGSPFEHDRRVYCAAFSGDGKLLVTSCIIDYGEHERHQDVYAWDIHTILKDAHLEDLLFIPDTAAVAGTKSLIDSDAIRRRRPARHARQLPRGFFDDAPDGVHSSATHDTSRRHAITPSSRPYDFLGRFSSLFHGPQPTTDPGESTELQHSPRRHISPHHNPRAVDVAPVRDKQALYVAPRQERVSDRAKHIKNPTWWTRCILFICCVSVPSPETEVR